MKKILTIFLWLISVSVFAQTQNISGKVTDSAGLPLPGATIVVKGTTTGTITNTDGNYELPNVSSESILVFSFVGMLTQEITVGNQSTISVTMLADAIGIDEVVAIGYGTVRKKDLTGSVSTVDTKEAYDVPVANLGTAIQGRAAGVQVINSSGAPGSNPSIRIRGGNSITAGNDPLYVIDGYVGAGDLSSINPNDIESMQILKDASSTAIYGARGANGVILITTKKGKTGKPTVNFKASYGIQVLPEKVDVQSGYEFAEWVNKIAPNQNNLPFDLNNLPGKETDWQDEMIAPAPIQDYQVSVSSGNEKTKYFLSAGYLSQEGIVKTSSFERFSIRSNVDSQLSEIFSTGLNISIARTSSDNNNISFRNLMRADPLMPVYNEDGTYNGTNYGVSNAQSNLMADNVLNQNDTNRDRALVNTYIQAKFLDNKLTLKSTFGGDFLWSVNDQFIPSTNPSSIRSGLLAQADVSRFNDTELLNENTIDYKQTFGDHKLNALGGLTFQSQNRQTVNVTGNEIPSDGVGVNALELAPVENTSINSNYSEYSIFSVFGRLNYSYKDRYLLTASVRYDGSSRLGENNKYATFPSMAVAWNVAEESFMQNVDLIDILKIRGTYGVTGNQGVSPFSTLATFNTVSTAAILNGGSVAGVRQGALANPDLKWETTSQYDLGLEISLFERRLSAEFDFYYKKTEDLLLDAEVPTHTGFSTTTQNVGSLENQGIDVNISGIIIDKSDFSWTASLNISKYKNKVLDLGAKSFITTVNMTGNEPAAQLRVGEPVGTFWGYKFETIDPETGDAVYTDISGPDGIPDGVISSEYDKTVIGDATPDFFGGINTNLRYKSFDVSAFLPFSYGNQNYNTEAFWASEVNINSLAPLRENMWTPAEPDNASFAGVNSTSMSKSSDFYLMNASFIRLATLQFGYTLPSGLLKGVSNFRIYATGTNLFLVKNKDYWGYDPDVSSYGDNPVNRGFDNYEYPQNRSFIIGLDITF